MAASDADRTLHRRLLDGDPTAFADLVLTHLGPAVAKVRRGFPWSVDDHLIREKANDSFLRLLDEPGRYDPDRGELEAFLVMDAAGDVRNALETERRRSDKLREIAVELVAGVRNEGGGDEPPACVPAVRDLIAAVFDDPADAEAALLMLDGERSTDRFAAIYGLSHLPAGERRKAVKRHKDRIMKALKRRGAEAL